MNVGKTILIFIIANMELFDRLSAKTGDRWSSKVCGKKKPKRAVWQLSLSLSLHSVMRAYCPRFFELQDESERERSVRVTFRKL